mgnify:CR=1 FL=1
MKVGPRERGLKSLFIYVVLQGQHFCCFKHWTLKKAAPCKRTSSTFIKPNFCHARKASCTSGEFPEGIPLGYFLLRGARVETLARLYRPAGAGPYLCRP